MSNTPKIVILVPCVNRPLLTKFCFEQLSYFKNAVKEKWIVDVVVVLSPEDAFFNELDAALESFDFHKYYYKNYSLGSKMNAGIGYIRDNFDFDYLMNFGSDDLIHPNIVDLYADYIQNECLLFGITKYYVYDALAGKTMFFKTHNEQVAIGAGRMIHKSILDRFWEKRIPLYDSIDRYLDTSSRTNILLNLDIKETLLNPGKFPFIVDIKTSKNITPLKILEPLTDIYEMVDNDILYREFVSLKDVFEKLIIDENVNLSVGSSNDISYFPLKNGNNDLFNSLLNSYAQLYKRMYQNECGQIEPKSKLLKLNADLFYGLMLENMYINNSVEKDKRLLEQELLMLKEQGLLMKEKLNLLHNSMSWKITAPLRFIYSKIFKSNN